MAFELLKSAECPKGDKLYIVNLYFDADTNMLKDEYVRDGEPIYYLEYEQPLLQEPENDADLKALIEAFNQWYDEVGPDWQPEAFYLNG